MDGYGSFRGTEACLFIWLFAFLVSFPPYEAILKGSHNHVINLEGVQYQIDHPLAPLPYPPGEHVGQIGMRLTLPLVSRALHLPVQFWLWLQPFAGMMFCWLLLKVLLKRIPPMESVLLAFGLACTFVVKAFNYDVVANFDGYAYLLLLGAVAVRSPLAMVPLGFAALFVDERAYLAMPYVLLARWMTHGVGLPRDWMGFLIDRETVLTLLTLIAGLAVRLGLSHYFGISSIREFRCFRKHGCAQLLPRPSPARCRGNSLWRPGPA